MELNRKDYRKYVSDDCEKCAMFIHKEYSCKLNGVTDKEWRCWSLKAPRTNYIFKLIKKG